MLGPVDALMRPLKIPPKFVAYMEKHRIYELFHELATALVIHEPPDHILYLKQSLRLASKKRDLPRIILLGAPPARMLTLAQSLQKKLSLVPISLRDIAKVSPEISQENFSEQDLVRNLIVILKKLATDYSGWILVDLPRTRSEARAIQLAGIVPTHVLEVVVSPKNRCENQRISDRRNDLRDLREIYSDLLIKIETGHRNIDDLAEACAILMKRKKHCGAPCLFRVALIGSRGSGCRSFGRHLSRRFNLVHVDFDQILEQTRLQQNPLGKFLRTIECRCDARPEPEIRILVVKKYLLSPDSTKRGWVLTGYPITVKDFELLDMLPTPPNRVIVVNVDKKIRRERLLSRQYNLTTGSKNDLCRNGNKVSDDKEFFVRPKDDTEVVETDIEEYDKNLETLLKYIGDSGTIVDGNADERIVEERVEACLIRPAPCAPPRIPKLQDKIKPIEFEPDDEPDPRIFDEIRQAESALSLF